MGLVLKYHVIVFTTFIKTRKSNIFISSFVCNFDPSYNLYYILFISSAHISINNSVLIVIVTFSVWFIRSTTDKLKQIYLNTLTLLTLKHTYLIAAELYKINFA